MFKITLKSKRGNFTIELQQRSFQFGIGDKVYCKSPYYTRYGTYEIIDIEEINK